MIIVEELEALWASSLLSIKLGNDQMYCTDDVFFTTLEKVDAFLMFDNTFTASTTILEASPTHDV